MLGRSKTAATETMETTELDVSALPIAIDWRTKGAVNPVQNQEQCGSCWAFASTAAIEGAHAIRTGDLPKLSEQQLVDCDKRSSGCNGGLEVYAYQYAEKAEMDLESAYPYTGQDGRCKAKKNTGMVGVTSYVKPTPNSVKQLKASLVQGPTSVAVEADTRPW